MQKILILANNDVGLYKFRKEIIQELVNNYKVFLSLPDGEYIPRLKEIGCEFIDTPISRRGTNPLIDLKLILNYKEIIKNIKPDIVLTYTIKPNVYGSLACILSKVPYITNITGLGTAVENTGLLQKITLLLYRTSLQKSRCIFFQNKENEEFFNKKKITRGNNRLIPGSGVNLESYSFLEYPPNDKTQFLFIARVMKEKGIDQYLDTAEYIKGKYPNTEFHVLGFCEEAYQQKLKEMQNRGVIQFHGMQSDVRKFHKMSHCTIHPTYYPEGMSNVLLESAACGRPIITTDRSGCREIVDDGVNGFIVKKQNSEDLIIKVEKFLNLKHEEKKKMGLKSREKVEKVFDRKIVIDAYIEEIEKTLR
jgi:glycosyltransferase involved in cell wall biosynthesis